ncbi:hypothetical protein KAX06_02200 [candidate division WOR-3 bacterium]|nr:hypothetical protein [candidate division WOR-3 bacterium]MCK4333580.1 hypothetical protein [candidate division WOR-3 bacterium]
MKNLSFSEDGVCTMHLEGVTQPREIENLIEEYVTGVEILPHHLRVILIDISELVHMGARSRQVFSELLMQASKHYGGKVELVIACGSLNLRRFIQLFCKGIGFQERSHFFEHLKEAQAWISKRSAEDP